MEVLFGIIIITIIIILKLKITILVMIILGMENSYRGVISVVLRFLSWFLKIKIVFNSGYLIVGAEAKLLAIILYIVLTSIPTRDSYRILGLGGENQHLSNVDFNEILDIFKQKNRRILL